MKQTHHQRRRKRKKNHHIVLLLIYILVAVLLLLALIALAIQMLRTPLPLPPETEDTTIVITEKPSAETELIPQSEAETENHTDNETDFSDIHLEETDIYSFLQGPKAWSMKADWSGSWCNIVLADQEFSVFGCGLCDMASIYGTLSPYDCSPIDMFYYAKEVSDYSPVSGFGAIDWKFMQQTLKTAGITSKLKRKDRTYEKFQESIASAVGAIVLVNSGNDDTYWQNTPGHYVNIWLYDPADDTIFLGDSGNPDHNRQRIPLRYIYDALKTANTYQYQLILGYNEDENTWKHDGIDIKWTKPKYYKK